MGVLSLQERAEIDSLFDTICDRICCLGEAAHVALPQPLQPETRAHSSMYHINFSGEETVVVLPAGLAWCGRRADELLIAAKLARNIQK